jgi:hypothetical protein
VFPGSSRSRGLPALLHPLRKCRGMPPLAVCIRILGNDVLRRAARNSAFTPPAARRLEIPPRRPRGGRCEAPRVEGWMALHGGFRTMIIIMMAMRIREQIDVSAARCLGRGVAGWFTGSRLRWSGRLAPVRSGDDPASRMSAPPKISDGPLPRFPPSPVPDGPRRLVPRRPARHARRRTCIGCDRWKQGMTARENSVDSADSA